MTRATLTYTPTPDDDTPECVICEQALPAHDQPRFRVTTPHGPLCPDCATDADPALAAAARVLNQAATLSRRLPPGTPAVEAFHATLLHGLRTLRQTR